MNILYILLALVVLMVLITVHEAGHYTAGKIFGFKINEFSIGFGPKIYKHVNKKTGELFSIRALPLGGFCSFEGEDEDNPTPGAFNNQKPWKRLIVLVSGVLFNFIFGIITAAIFLMVNGYARPMVVDFSPNNPNNGILLENDIITHVNGKSIEIYRDLSALTKKIEAGENITLTVIRDVDGEQQIIELENIQKYKTEAFFFAGLPSAAKDKVFLKDEEGNLVSLTEKEFRQQIINIKPVLKEDGKTYEDFTQMTGEDEEKIATFYKADGTAYTDKEIVDLAHITLSTPNTSIGFVMMNVQARYGFFESLLKAWPFCFYICGLILSALGGLFTGATKLRDLGGTVTAISQIAEVSKIGFTSFLLLLPMLAMNLALFNILPIPALDGAHCVFVLIEWIFKKPVPRKIENIINTVGLFVLLGLVVFLDIYHFFIL